MIKNPKSLLAGAAVAGLLIGGTALLAVFAYLKNSPIPTLNQQ